MLHQRRMSTSHYLLLASLLSTALCTEGVISLDVSRVAMTKDPNGLYSRATHSDDMSNQRFFYSSTVQVGTPSQQLTLLLDTGSSDTWVFSPATKSQSSGGIFGFGGSSTTIDTTLFDSSKSSTFKSNNSNWQIQYGMGTASGSWGTDTFSIGNAKLKSLSIGVANTVSQISQGLVGLGRKEAEITNKNGYTYDNLPWRLKAEGQISSAAYSVFMNDINSKSGTILFGGVDHDRYKGALVSLPISHPKHLGVQLHGISSDGRAQGNLMNTPQTAILDSGTSLTYVPSDVLTSIRTALNANPSFTIGEKYYCDCNITNNLIFNFGSTSVSVPAYNFLWPIEEFVNPTTAQLNFPQNSCYLGIEEASSDENFMLLGDNVLRAMYVVYDLENNHIAVAEANTGGSGQSQVEAIVGGVIPNANVVN